MTIVVIALVNRFVHGRVPMAVSTISIHIEACYRDSVEKLGSEDSTEPIRNVKGSLRQKIDFLRSVNAYESVLDMSENGNKVPFIETPSSKIFKKNKSALDNTEFGNGQF